MGREALKSFARKAAVSLLAGGLVAAGSVTAEAFTIISLGKPHVTVTPTSGLAAASFTARAKFVLNGSCPATAPVALTFKFYWYKVISSKVPLWTKTTSACNASVWDTGNSPALQPPPPLNYPGTFVVQVAVYVTSTGKPAGTTYTDTTLYTVLAPKPKPSPRQIPSPSPSPSPSPAQCTAALPPSTPGGKDAEALLGVAAVGLLPIGGIAMVFSPGLWSRSRRWGKLAAVLGLTVMTVVSATACTPPKQLAGSSPESSPSQSAFPSPSPTPSCQT
jgi:hypothetical protein